MMQLIGIVGAIVFLVAVNFYARYVFQRFGLTRGNPPEFAMSWPRGKRLVLFWLAIGITVIAIPFGIVAVGDALGTIDCSPHFSPGDPSGCSPVARFGFALGVLVLGLPLGAMWVRFLADTLRRDASHDD
jgi:hypothetical protein